MYWNDKFLQVWHFHIVIGVVSLQAQSVDRSPSDSNVPYRDVFISQQESKRKKKNKKDLLFLSEKGKRQTDITKQSCTFENQRV